MERDQRASDLKPESGEGKTQPADRGRETKTGRRRDEAGRRWSEDAKMVDQRRATNIHYYYVNHYAF